MKRRSLVKGVFKTVAADYHAGSKLSQRQKNRFPNFDSSSDSRIDSNCNDYDFMTNMNDDTAVKLATSGFVTLIYTPYN